MNYKHNPVYVLNGWKCLCGEEDSQSHLLHCLHYEHLRNDLNLETNDHDLVLFFQRVVREREKREKRGLEVSEETIFPSFNDSSHNTSHDSSRDNVNVASSVTNNRQDHVIEKKIAKQRETLSAGSERHRGGGVRARELETHKSQRRKFIDQKKGDSPITEENIN